MEKVEEIKTFDSIRLKLASPDDIHRWSHGEVTKPETINYRTQKPEKDGLFCERIFGPTKDWECYCGKYKRIRYKGIICDKCGVEVTHSSVRRQRLGHIELAAPVSHIWFLRGIPSKVGLVLGLSPQNLEKVIYFASYIIMKVDQKLIEQTLEQIKNEAQSKKKSIENEYQRDITQVKQAKGQELARQKDQASRNQVEEKYNKELENCRQARDEKLKNLEEAVNLAKKELRSLQPLEVISETQYHDISIKYGHVFEVGIGAEAIRNLLALIDLDDLINKLQTKFKEAPENQRRKLQRRIKLLKNFQKNKIRPEWMILKVIPIIPPDLRPMVQLDGGRFATSDLNDLYRRIINRNNRLKRLIELNAPEVIQRNEKRMLQEAVDALIDNTAREGKTVAASTGQKRMLKSLADILKGKQGRFRQNLLGKRIDYSGRSVIVVGPELRLNECGIPKIMALELFKPFVISELIKREIVYNVRSASRFIESEDPIIWDILEEITKKSYVLLNRAPTLHRLGIQAFRPVLIEGKAIQLHPMVCPPFNADFDGDQMAVHVPLTEKAVWEAKEIMISTKNLLKPATGKLAVSPHQDVILGCYYLTFMHPQKKPKVYSSREEAHIAYEANVVNLHDQIKVKIGDQIIDTTVGRIIFNWGLPPETKFINEVLNRPRLGEIFSEFLEKYGPEEIPKILDSIKTLSFRYLTQSGISWGIQDLTVPKEKVKIIEAADQEVEKIQKQYNSGLLTEYERHVKIVDLWTQAKDKVTDCCKKTLDRMGPIYAMIDSQARGSWAQITQMMGMKGLVTNPMGETIELPVKGSFKEGFDVLEYYISTHGARKGLSDTALRTASAGYLTRRLVDVAQDVVITEEDCQDKEGLVLTKEESEALGTTLAERAWGRVSLSTIKDPKTKKTVIRIGDLIDEAKKRALERYKIDEMKVRSVSTCKVLRGICRKCYGYDLGYNHLVELGTAVGIIAAQSIGEPGTQLTMRTFHTGGVAGQDITQGLPRVEELFEARPVKKAAVIATKDAQVEVEEREKQRYLRLITSDNFENKYYLNRIAKSEPGDWQIKITSGTFVLAKEVLALKGKYELKAKNEGKVKIEKDVIIVTGKKKKVEEHAVSSGFAIWVKDGQQVNKGQQLTEGNLNLQQLYELKGRLAVQKYIVKEIQSIYSSQGQRLNEKHIEVIVRQMFSRVQVIDSGDSEFAPGEIIEKATYEITNKELAKAKKKPFIGKELLYSISKVSLTTDSFLSAASFQETSRALIEAAINGRIDHLRGLKENVIIGRLIPAGTGFKPKK